jgi:hypothetical protein
VCLCDQCWKGCLSLLSVPPAMRTRRRHRHRRCPQRIKPNTWYAIMVLLVYVVLSDLLTMWFLLRTRCAVSYAFHNAPLNNVQQCI